MISLNEDTVEVVQEVEESYVRRGNYVCNEERKEQNHTWNGHPAHSLDIAP